MNSGIQAGRAQARMQGFSLIEIIVVITIIGLIVGWAATSIFGKQDQAQGRIAKSKITAMSGLWTFTSSIPESTQPPTTD